VTEAKQDNEQHGSQDGPLPPGQPLAQGAKLASACLEEFGAPAPRVLEAGGLVPHVEPDPGRLPHRYPEQLAIRDPAAALNTGSLRKGLRQADAVPSDRPAEVHDLPRLAKEDEGDHLKERQQQELRDQCDEPDPRGVLRHRPKPVPPDVIARRLEWRGADATGEGDRVAGFSTRLDPYAVAGEAGAPADV
jgi:hypothetical protein